MFFGMLYAERNTNIARYFTRKEDIMTHEIKKILYATDLSANSEYALGFAVNSASLYHAEMVILHVFDNPVIGYAPMLNVYVDEKNRQSLFSEHSKGLKDKIRKRLEKISAKEIKRNPEYRDIAISIEVCTGFPAETILNVADDLNCDMIIMGTHGKGLLGHTFLGSTAKRVLRRTRKPIFIIPLPKGNVDLSFQDE
jgi:nucleotide-binding universal stress UspA family protein